MNKSEKTILYIDDEQENLDGFQFIFQRNYNIFCTTSIKEAFEIIKENEIKLIISDQRMPEMSGLEFINKVKISNPDIICIILTAYADMEAVLQAVNQGGIYRFMMKPWDENDLKLSIDQAIEKYEISNENKRLLEYIKLKNSELEQYNNELKTTIEDLTIAKEKAEESDRLKQSFLQNMSHEIRTPMNGILGFADLLKADNLDNKTRLSYLEIIVNCGQQLMNIIENILDIAKIESGQMEIYLSEINLNRMIDDIYHVHSILIDNEKVKFKVNHSFDNKTLIKSDSVKIRQIIDNLISNAKKFTIEGEIILHVSMEENLLHFKIEDTGIGIPEEKINDIFKPFRQVSNIKNILNSGTGLGLAITKSYIELLNGHISVNSTENKGTIFDILIPIEHISKISEHTIGITNDLYFNHPYTVLIVEDDEVNFTYIDTILKRMNLNTLHAKSGDEVFRIFNIHKNIDIVLMDIKLPDMSGLEIVERLRQNNITIPIIAQTSYALTNTYNDAIKAGCNNFITKPMMKKTLYNVIKENLEPTIE